MPTDELRHNIKNIHRQAVGYANQLAAVASESRVLNRQFKLRQEDATELAETLVTLMGLNNTLLALLDQGEEAIADYRIAATTGMEVISYLRRAKFGEVFRWWLRQKAHRA